MLALAVQDVPSWVEKCDHFTVTGTGPGVSVRNAGEFPARTTWTPGGTSIEEMSGSSPSSVVSAGTIVCVAVNGSRSKSSKSCARMVALGEAPAGQGGSVS